ncbi:MAG: zinc-ribbon domain-containing protein [Rhizobiales bacterium]|nr:zinc-ribbon domain-containing protein [Hyphomicrobiales bacterium]
MLIVCPSCATSYMIDPASVGPGGRTVRCARCKTTWFAGGPKSAPEVTAFVDGVIREAETQSAGAPGSASHSADAAADNAPRAADNFAGEPSEPLPEPPFVAPKPEPAPPVEQAPHHTDLVPRDPIAPEPVAITDSPSLVPPIEHAATPAAAHAEIDHDEIETFAARRQRLKARRLQARKSSRWTALILLLFAFNVALVGARHEVVRYLPQTASLFAAIGLPVNLRNLKFDNVRISKEGQDGVSILIIEGSIVSTASKPTEVPRLRFAARNATGQEVYTWTAQPSRSILDAGERLDFSSRLPSPPAEASDIMVRFFNSQDAVAGAK